MSSRPAKTLSQRAARDYGQRFGMETCNSSKARRWVEVVRGPVPWAQSNPKAALNLTGGCVPRCTTSRPTPV